MKKYIIILIILAVAVGAYFWLRPVSPVEQVAKEVASLEKELKNLSETTASGTISVAEADAAKAEINQKLTSLREAARASEDLQLTTEERDTLVAQLNIFKETLISFHETLNTVESYDSNQESDLSRDNLVFTFAMAVKRLEETVTDSVRSYTKGGDLDTAVDALITITKHKIDEATDNATSTDNGTTSEATEVIGSPIEITASTTGEVIVR